MITLMYDLFNEIFKMGKWGVTTKLAGETDESTVEHIARYLIVAGDIANNENLKLKYFPSSLTKNVTL